MPKIALPWVVVAQWLLSTYTRPRTHFLEIAVGIVVTITRGTPSVDDGRQGVEFVPVYVRVSDELKGCEETLPHKMKLLKFRRASGGRLGCAVIIILFGVFAAPVITAIVADIKRVAITYPARCIGVK